jgi:hypothetical protein
MSDVTNALAAMYRPPVERLYVFSYDFLHPTLSVEAMVTYIRDTRHISGWSYLNPGLYLIRSYEGANTLTKALTAITGNARLMVAEINLSNLSGNLPNPAWEWIYGLTAGTLGSPAVVDGKRTEPQRS